MEILREISSHEIIYATLSFRRKRKHSMMKKKSYSSWIGCEPVLFFLLSDHFANSFILVRLLRVFQTVEVSKWIPFIHKMCGIGQSIAQIAEVYMFALFFVHFCFSLYLENKTLDQCQNQADPFIFKLN